MSTLKSLYEAEGPDLLDRLHTATQANRKYLYQIATGIRKPSAGLARRLTTADPRLTLTELLFPDEAQDLPAATTPASRSGPRPRQGHA
ncbi:hypothetical protein ABE485_12155 [Achromobacter spanius]|uniref:hypothetical protein n=1 Tax=Achromobacter spanius TaxID=217203 RepID=UPI00320B37A6